MYPLTVEEAITHGRKTILLPTIIIFVGLPITTYFITVNVYAVLISPMILLLSAVLAGIYRAYAVPRWMVQAFAQVRNVHELRREAVFAMLIPGEENKGLRRFEIWNDQQREEWRQLEQRFNLQDEFIDNPEIPAETRICYSIWKRLLSQISYLAIIGFALLLLILPAKNPASFKTIWTYLVSVIFAAIGFYLTWRNIRQMINRKPQIIISNDGLTTAIAPFYPWSAITNLYIMPRGTARNRSYYLEYFAGQVHVSLELEALDKSRKNIDRLLRLYRGRFKASTSKAGKSDIRHQQISR